MIYLFWVNYQGPQRVLAAEVGVSVSHRFGSIDARSRHVVFDSAYTKSRLKVLCPSGLINGKYIGRYGGKWRT